MWLQFIFSVFIALTTAFPDAGFIGGFDSYFPPQQQQHHHGIGSNGGEGGGYDYKPQQGYDYTPQKPLVTKDVYVHVPPNELENQIQHQTVNLGPPRKHYRVLFIKTPSHGATTISLIPPETEEKTIVYVLSKKNDASDVQTHINANPTEPSKPEVYFIKYRTQEEAALAQRQIQAQFDQLGGTTQVSDEGQAPVHSVIGSLGGGPRGIGIGGSGGFGSSGSSAQIASSNAVSFSDNGNAYKAPNYLPPVKKKVVK